MPVPNDICGLNANLRKLIRVIGEIKAEIWTKVVQICRFFRRLRADRPGSLADGAAVDAVAATENPVMVFGRPGQIAGAVMSGGGSYCA